MVSTTETWDDAAEVIEHLSPEARQALVRSQDIMDHAALLRASCWMHEDAVRECESRMRSRRMDDPTVRRLLRQCAETVAEAGDLHRKVRDREGDAMPHLAAVIARLRGPAAGDAPRHTLVHLERCADLRDRALAKLHDSLQHADRLVRTADRIAPEEALELLEKRRRLLAEADEFRLEAENRERLALLADDREPIDASPAGTESGPVPAFPRTRSFALGERIEREEADWESWIGSMQSGARRAALATGDEPFLDPEVVLAELKAMVIAAEKRLEQGLRWADERVYREELERHRVEVERDQALALVESLSRRLMTVESRNRG